MTLNQLSTRFYSTYGKRPVLPKALVPPLINGLTEKGMGYAHIMARLIEEIKEHYPFEPRESMRDIFKAVFSELAVPDEVTGRALGALDIFGKYGDLLEARGFVDAEDAGRLAADIIERQVSIDTLFLDGFYEITPVEELLIKALIVKAERTFVTIPISDVSDDLSYCYSNFLKDVFNVEPVHAPSDGKPPGMFYHPAPSMEEEVEAMARHIKNSFISGRLADLEDTFVVFPDLAPYREMVERVLSRYGIPYSMTARRPLSMKRPYLDLMSLLEAVSEDYPRLPTGRFLASPHFRNIPEKVRLPVPGICLSSGIIKGRDSWLKALREGGVLPEGRRIFNKLSILENIKYKGSYGTYIKVISDILRALGFSPSDDDMPETDTLLQRLGLLDEILGGETDLGGFSEALRRVIDSVPYGKEAPGVQVASLFEVRGLEPRMLYFGGLKDGDIPSRPEMDLLLPDGVRKRLGLVDMTRHLHLQEKIFRRLTRASRGLHLSYPTMDGDKFFLPSLFLSGGTERAESVYGVFSREEDMLRKVRPPLSTHIREVGGIQRFRDRLTLNVTDIDSYRACPRKYFIEKVLGLEPPEIREYEVDPVLIGTVTHGVMEKLITPLPEDLEAMRERAGRVLDEVLGPIDMEEYFKGLIKESFLAVLPEIHGLEELIRSEGYAFKESEFRVEEELLEGIRLRGKIDRLDARAGDGGPLLEVIDYKTGSWELGGPQTLRRGTALQLFLYAALLKATGRRAERVGIYSLRDLKLKWVPGRRDLKEGRTLEDYVEASLRFLEETVARMRQGDFAALPLSEQTCRQCHERPYCPFIQGSGHGQGSGSGQGPGSAGGA
jgi:RecB family exonuclease